MPFAERRARLEALVARLDASRIDISPLVPFATWDELTAARADPASAGAGADAEAVEGVMLKRRDALYLPGRPKGLWWKWKRDPHVIDAVLMYAQRGTASARRSIPTIRSASGPRARAATSWCRSARPISASPTRSLPRSTASSGATPINRFGPVREVAHEPDKGLVMEVAFEGLAALDAPQVRRRDALPAHQPAALGQAAARGRPAGDAGEDAARRGRDVGAPARARFSGADS